MLALLAGGVSDAFLCRQWNESIYTMDVTKILAVSFILSGGVLTVSLHNIFVIIFLDIVLLTLSKNILEIFKNITFS